MAFSELGCNLHIWNAYIRNYNRILVLRRSALPRRIAYHDPSWRCAGLGGLGRVDRKTNEPWLARVHAEELGVREAGRRRGVAMAVTTPSPWAGHCRAKELQR